MRIGLYTARYLGEAIANIVHASGANIVARHHEATGWWGTAGTNHTDNVFATKPDLVISCLTNHIFTPAELAATPLGIVNLHPAPLPEYRGCNSYSHAIINNSYEYGVTLHQVDAGIDTGPIISDTRWPIPEGCTARELHDMAQAHAAQVFAQWWSDIMHGEPPCAAAAPQWAVCAPNAPTRYYRRNSLDAYRNLADHPPHQHDAIRRGLTFPPFPMPKEPA